MTELRLAGWFKLLDMKNGAERCEPVLPPDEEAALERSVTAVAGEVKFVSDALGSYRIVRDPTAVHAHAHAHDGDACDVAAKSKRPASVRQGRRSSFRTPAASAARKYGSADFNFLKVLGQGSYGKVRVCRVVCGR